MKKRKYEWTKKQERAIRETLRLWLPVQKRLVRGEKITGGAKPISPVLTNDGESVRLAPCPLCDITEDWDHCSDCVYKIARTKACNSRGEMLTLFEKNPGKRSVNRIVNFLEGLLPDPERSKK